MPTTALATEPSGEARCPASSAAPSARTVPSRASSVARRGSVVWRVSRSPGRRPGNASERDQAIRVPEPLPCIGSVKSLESVPNRRVCTRTGTSTPPATPRGLPVTRMPVAGAVAVVSAPR